MGTCFWIRSAEMHSVLCLEWLFKSRWLSHRSVISRDQGHLWNTPPPTSTNTVQPTGTEIICMPWRTPWATKQSHKMHVYIQMICWCHQSPDRVFLLLLLGWKLIKCWRWEPKCWEVMIYLILMIVFVYPGVIWIPQFSSVFKRDPVVWCKSRNFALWTTSQLNNWIHDSV